MLFVTKVHVKDPKSRPELNTNNGTQYECDDNCWDLEERVVTRYESCLLLYMD